MRKLFVLVIFMFICASLGLAQDRRPEIFVGYSNLQAEGIPSQELNQTNSFDDEVFGERAGLHGVNAEITGYVTPRFGLTGDFSYHQRTRSFSGAGAGTGAGAATTGEIDTRVFQFLGGPTVRFPNETRVTPFLRSLFGVANTRFEVEQRQQLPAGTVTSSFNTSSTDFAMALGGGLDVRVNERFALRALQVDYNPVFLRDRSINVLGGAGAVLPQTLEGQREDNIRLSFGVVFK
ncbi:MAG TPA: outer membrane beta-barrel protein [Pyrinomonadaceae bacterium]|jgi:opacity protein-like surface antigen|nr:outer membrane beta-barrel protein [Pyrinomonadaceae bacterium]